MQKHGNESEHELEHEKEPKTKMREQNAYKY